jgi:hypothetical protein
MRPDGVDEAARPEHGGLAQDLHAAARARPQGFIRTKEGATNCSGLPLIRYTTDELLEEIVQIHRDHAVFIADPHVYIVEDGKQGQVNPDVVATKMRFDPLGLLNPGKLRGCGQP